MIVVGQGHHNTAMLQVWKQMENPACKNEAILSEIFMQMVRKGSGDSFCYLELQESLMEQGNSLWTEQKFQLIQQGS